MTNVYIGLGSNLNNPIYQIKKALQVLKFIPATHLQTNSNLYRSEAIGPKNQPNYINAVAILSTRLSSFNLLHELQSIETERGRTRNGKRWQARILDLDILMYDNKQLHTKKLILPHPELYNRIIEVRVKLILACGSTQGGSITVMTFKSNHLFMRIALVVSGNDSLTLY
ncbi:MAG: 2-amino-4-hydroxy-6-hydroxymethyldihydropteridine diphosphokinase [Candidatus Marithrix sp.]|nr:2-amino-4-hydroxy-6-hydroxymethyldihydropteridine diphosphokinase [Candidatus Marithrix sp.]